MGSRYEVEVKVGSARDLKNVNWRTGDLKPYAVLWIDDGAKCSSRVDVDNGESPVWDDKLFVQLPPSSARLEDAVLYVDVVHSDAAEQTNKPIIGSARLSLREILDDAGIGGRVSRSLPLKRPSGRPQGRLSVRVSVREAARHYDRSLAASHPPPYVGPRDPYAAAAPYGSAGYGSGGYGQPPYGAPPPHSAGYPGAYGAPPPHSAGYPGAYGAPPPHSAGYPGAYGAAPPHSAGYPAAYGAAPPTQPAYGAGAPAPLPADGADGYRSDAVAEDPTKKKKGGMGMGTGLAIGAAAGVVGGLALAGGASYLGNKFDDKVAEKVEEELATRDREAEEEEEEAEEEEEEEEEEKELAAKDDDDDDDLDGDEDD